MEIIAAGVDPTGRQQHLGHGDLCRRGRSQRVFRLGGVSQKKGAVVIGPDSGTRFDSNQVDLDKTALDCFFFFVTFITRFPSQIIGIAEPYILFPANNYSLN